MISGRIVSIINHKGGVGKTTTAVNLGEARSRNGIRILVIDLDPQCNTTDILLPHKSFQYTVFDVLHPEQEGLEPEQCVYETPVQGLHCLPNRPDSTFLEPQLIGMGPAGFRLFRTRLQPYLKESFDLTIIDNPPNLSTFVASSLLASDYVIIPCDAGSTGSLRGFSKALDFIKEIQESGNPDLKFFKGLITKVDRRTSMWKAIIERRREELGEDWVFKTVIPMNTDFQKSEFSGRTIFQTKPSAPGAVAYAALANELLEYLDIGSKQG